VRLRIDLNRLDRWQELFEVVGRNKLRTLLTGLMVSWGIFILIILLGAGAGMHNGAEHSFRDDALNSIFMFGGSTSKPWKGHKVGREVRFKNDDYENLRDNVREIDHITGRYFLWRQDSTIRRGDKYSSFQIRSVHPDHIYLEKTIILEGRYINNLDIERRRKVAVIGIEAKTFLFGDEPAIGETIEVAGLAYQVIGVSTDEGGEGELRVVYIPISTAQAAYSGGNDLHMIMFTMGDADAAESKKIADNVRHMMAEKHHFDPDDPRAIRMRNNLERFEEIGKVLQLIEIFVWLIGLGTIFAGIVGVSNIMLIAVKERTREFGIRKALGATPSSIIGMVVLEAIVLTAAAGYLGMFAGVMVLDLGLLPEHDYLRDPEIHLRPVLVAMGLLVFFGTLAGYFPARRAAKVNPVVALRDE
jgi:putative ABC transport system permease protein